MKFGFLILFLAMQMPGFVQLPKTTKVETYLGETELFVSDQPGSPDLNEENQEERVQFANGPVELRIYELLSNNEDGDVNYPRKATLSSMKWRKESGD